MTGPFRLLFLGWWMAGQSWMVTGQHYPKPSFSVSPEIVTLGGTVTILCSNAEHPRAEFSLHKRDWTRPLYKMAKHLEAEFIISNTRISDAGIYFCQYCLLYYSQNLCSHYSDEVHINVADPSLPKPSIKVKPGHQNALYSSVTIECQGPEGYLYLFRKANDGEISWVAAVLSATANFNFSKMGRKDAGSYTCQYRSGTPFIWSVPSDPVELIVTDPYLSKPSIKVKPEGQHEVGMNVTIECEGSKEGLTFSLHKSKDFPAARTVTAESDTAKFPLSPLRPEDAGNYTCQYYDRKNRFLSSEPSDHVEVVVTDNSQQTHMIIIWASVAAGLLLVLVLLVLTLVLCKKRRKRSTVKEGNQPVNRGLEQNAGMGLNDTADHDGVTYAVLDQHALKTKQPASQQAGPESCIYASVAKE